MRGCRKKKIYYVLVFVLILLGFSIGYAVLNSTLIINGKSNISKNTWSVHFENIKITDGSITASVEPVISNNTTISNFELTLDKPGDFYEFTVDVKNSGTIDAMIDSVVKTPDLTETQQKYLNYIIEYQNGEQITTKQLVKSEEFVRLKVRVEYKKDLVSSDLPTESETLTLGLNINYVQVDDSGVSVKNNGQIIEPVAYGDINEVGTFVTIGTEQFYTIGTEGDNVKLLSAKLITLDENPIQDSNATLSYFAESARDDVAYSVYEGSTIESHVNNYKDNLERKYDVDIIEARLITIDELTSEKIGCSVENYCYNAPSFIYSTRYWTGSAKDDSHVWIAGIGGFLYDGGGQAFSSGVRPVIVISKSDIVFSNDNSFANGDINEIGTIVTIGTEQFYTIGTEGENVKLLSMYNLHVGNEVTSTDLEDQPIVNKIANPTGLQTRNARGLLVDYYGNELLPVIGTTAFSSDVQKGTNYSDYVGSIVEGYVNNYKNHLESLGVPIAEARLITIDELTNEKIGCVADETGCTNAPSWIYSTTYWTGSVVNEEVLMVMISTGHFGHVEYLIDFGLGVRPVIVIPKDYFE